jgi:outer membrane protein OmpA-like peptidoglycan-associated protein
VLPGSGDRGQAKGERNVRTISGSGRVRALEGLVVGLMLLLGQHLAGSAEVTKEGEALLPTSERGSGTFGSSARFGSSRTFYQREFGPPRTTMQIHETKTEVRIELPGDVLFDFDKWDLRPDAESTLRQVADIIKHYPNAKVTIAGYTDAKGADTYNLRLSGQRASAVKAWLVRHGEVNGKQMTTKGWGEAKPVASNTHSDGSDNPEGRQKNRRVEVTVEK